MEEQITITQFLDADGKVVKLPRKQKPRLAVLVYLAEKFDFDCDYSEMQVNSICNSWITFGDYYTVRRELVDSRLLSRERDGSRYWRTTIKEPDATV